MSPEIRHITLLEHMTQESFENKQEKMTIVFEGKKQTTNKRKENPQAPPQKQPPKQKKERKSRVRKKCLEPNHSGSFESFGQLNQQL